jgi:hypothetical protein
MMSLATLPCLFMIIRALHVHSSFRPVEKRSTKQYHRKANEHFTPHPFDLSPTMAHESTQLPLFLLLDTIIYE